jgi:membrane protease YdiL (CAAX protease family)
MLRFTRDQTAARGIAWPSRSIEKDLAAKRIRLRAPSLTSSLAWIGALAISTLPNIIVREIIGARTDWLPTAKIIVIAALLALSLGWRAARPLRGFFFTLFIFYGSGRVLREVHRSPMWTSWFHGNNLFTQEMLGGQILRLATATLVIVALRLIGKQPKDLYLGCGNLCAPAEPVRWLDIRPGATWNRLGITFSAIACLGTSTFLFAVGTPPAGGLAGVLPLLPAILLFAAMNAFSEEVTFRSALLATLPESLGKQSRLLLTASYFGLAHYWGVPYGPLGVLLAGLLGWLLGKIMLETEGFFWPWFIHFLQDVVIYAFMAIGLVTAGGR